MLTIANGPEIHHSPLTSGIQVRRPTSGTFAEHNSLVTGTIVELQALNLSGVSGDVIRNVSSRMQRSNIVRII